jgi:hypothetical protein
MEVIDIIILISKGDEFMIVSSDKYFTLDLRSKIFDDSSSETKSIVGRSSSSKFIEDYETILGSIIDDISYFDHLRHEGGLILCDNIATSYTSEDTINQSYLSFTSWYK